MGGLANRESQGLDMNNEEGRRLEEVASTSLRSILAQEPRTFLRRLIPNVTKRFFIRAMETS